MTLALRSHLYVPADQERLLARCESRGADAVILDLEDAVAESRKDVALTAALEFLGTARTSGQRWVRVNSGERGLRELHALAGAGLDGVWFAKVEPGDWATEAIAIAVGAGIRLGLMIESARGIVGLPVLPELPTDTLTQLGEVDLRADLRIRDSSEEAMVPYRARIVMETAIRGLPAAVGPVDPYFDDLDAFRAGTILLRDRGFSSRACIHPSQVTIVNEVFTPTAEEVAQARRVLDEFERQASEGVGAYRAADGSMVDAATVRRARETVEAARE